MFPPQTVAVGSRDLAYGEWGDPEGVPVFALHGTPGCRLYRHPVDARLAETGARLVTYDRPGYGRSMRQPGRRVVDCVEDVVALADHLGIERFAVMGTSGGGPHCLAVAALLPERVLRARCVVGVAPYDAPGLDWFDAMDPANVCEFGWALEGEDMLTVRLQAQARDLVSRAQQAPAEVLGDFALSESDRLVMQDPVMQQLIGAAVPETFADGVGGWIDDDLAFVRPWGFDLSDVRVPVEIWYGDGDVLVPAAHGAWLGRNVPGASVVVDRSGGHLRDPEESLRALHSLVTAAKAAV
jgi:pimeloyl-ACP methyl ester carboxylesterase